tara:strand:- start:13929 stop:14492 length:564 start_codon:yes stop_codon:yes gene_type:complete
MKIIGKSIILLFITSLFAMTAFAAKQVSPTGYWQTVDDKTGIVLSLVQIYKAKNGDYRGRIYEIGNVIADGKRQNPADKCTACTGPLKNKLFLGMGIIWGMAVDPSLANTWDQGTVYDPRSDTTYHAKMWLTDNGQKLHLRGYVGFPLLGRTQVWLRTTAAKPSKWVTKLTTAQTIFPSEANITPGK